jgi:hypothetical protein
MHGAAFATPAAIPAAKNFVRETNNISSLSDEMTMRAVGAGHNVLRGLFEMIANPNRTGLSARVKVRKAENIILFRRLVQIVLERTDKSHLRISGDEFFI